jgi:hypothetical protein
LRTIEEIMAAMTALMDGAADRALTAEEITNYEALEAELTQARADAQARQRHAAYNAVPNPLRPAGPAEVREPLPYNVARVDGRAVFNRGTNGHDFSSDVFAIINTGGSDADAVARVNSLIGAAFNPTNDVDRADTASLNPNRYAPELWQPQMDFSTPLWDMINSGTTDGTSFDVPKYNSSSGLVGPATEGVEPAPGAMTVTSQTITPTQVWGKVEVTRQAARRGGRPELSGILWDQMLREYYEDREAAVATFLNTLTAATDITVTGSPASPTNDNDQTSVQSLEASLVDLLFARGGNRFRAFAVHQALYRLLARVTDDSGRPLYPQISPMNANGTAEQLWTTLSIGGVRAVPAWALGTVSTTPTNSWLFDPTKVRGWASAPERLDWNFGTTIQTTNIPQLSHVTIGIYGDVAFANLDINGVRQVIFDPNTAA